MVSCNPCSANNHLLNSMLVKLFYFCLGEGLFTARLVNVVFFLVYGFYSIKWSVTFHSLSVQLLVLLALLLNPFLLDFFSLARGYGVCLALLLGAAYHLKVFWENLAYKQLIFCLLFSTLSAYANFSSIHFTALAFGLSAFAIVSKPCKNRALQLGIWAFLLATCVALLYLPISKLLEQGRLFYGGEAGIINDTFLSLAAYWQGTPFSQNLAWPLLWFCFISYFILFVIFFWHLASGANAFKINVVAHVAFLGCVFSILAQQYILDTRWLIDRTALFLYPLFILSWCTLFNAVLNQKTHLRKYVAYTLAGGVFLNFALNANFYKTLEWQQDAQSEAVVAYLQKHAKKGGEINLDCSWPIESSLPFYTYHAKYDKVNYVGLAYHRDSVKVVATHYLFYNQPIKNVRYYPETVQPKLALADTVLSFPEDKLYLLKLAKQ